MFCNECNESFYGQMMSTGTCKLCGKPTPTPHIPSYEVCKECAVKNNLCQQCGKFLKP